MCNRMQLVLVAIIAMLCGSFGGVVAARYSMRAEANRGLPDAIRARRFEAVARDGSVRMRIDAERQSIELLAANGSQRFQVQLDALEEPALLFRDGAGNVRASLGHDPTDTPEFESNAWSLTFEPQGNSEGYDLASMGIATKEHGQKLRGYVFVRDTSGKFIELNNER